MVTIYNFGSYDIISDSENPMYLFKRTWVTFNLADRIAELPLLTVMDHSTEEIKVTFKSFNFTYESTDDELKQDIEKTIKEDVARRSGLEIPDSNISQLSTLPLKR